MGKVAATAAKWKKEESFLKGGGNRRRFPENGPIWLVLEWTGRLWKPSGSNLLAGL